MDLKTEDFECPICIEKFDSGPKKPRMFACQHIFCERCIQDWLAKNPQFECPICRQAYQNLNVASLEIVQSLLEQAEEHRMLQIFLKNAMKKELMGRATCPACYKSLKVFHIKKRSNCDKCNRSLQISDNLVTEGYFVCLGCQYYVCCDCVQEEVVMNESRIGHDDDDFNIDDLLQESMGFEERKEDFPQLPQPKPQIKGNIAPSTTHPLLKSPEPAQKGLLVPPASPPLPSLGRQSSETDKLFDEVRQSLILTSPFEAKCEVPSCGKKYYAFSNLAGKVCYSCASNLQSKSDVALACIPCKSIVCLDCALK
jgi:uncharacterized protein YbaR (Trm112 family)